MRRLTKPSLVIVASCMAVAIVAAVAFWLAGIVTGDSEKPPATTVHPTAVQMQLTVTEVCELLREKLELPAAPAAMPRLPSGGDWRDWQEYRVQSRAWRRSRAQDDACDASFRGGTWTITLGGDAPLSNKATFSLRESTRVITATNDAARSLLQ